MLFIIVVSIIGVLFYQNKAKNSLYEEDKYFYQPYDYEYYKDYYDDDEEYDYYEANEETY